MVEHVPNDRTSRDARPPSSTIIIFYDGRRDYAAAISAVQLVQLSKDSFFLSLSLFFVLLPLLCAFFKNCIGGGCNGANQECVSIVSVHEELALSGISVGHSINYGCCSREEHSLPLSRYDTRRSIENTNKVPEKTLDSCIAGIRFIRLNSIEKI